MRHFPHCLSPATLVLLGFVVHGAAAQSVLVVENPAERLDYGKTYTRFDGFAGSDAYSGENLIAPTYLKDDAWPDGAKPKAGRNLTVTSARSSLGAWVSKLNVDYLYRREWWLEGSDGTHRFFELARRKNLVASAQNLAIDYRWDGFDADGLRFATARRASLFDRNDSVIGVSLAALRVLQMRRESGRGQFASDGSTATLDARREIWYSGLAPDFGNDKLTAFTPPAVMEAGSRGYGYSVDLGLRYQLGPGGAVRIAVSDALGRLKWNDMPHVVQQANIAATASEANFAVGQPGVSQTSDYALLSMEMPSKRSIGVDFPLSYKWQLHGDHVRYRSEDFTVLGASARLTDVLRLRGDYDLRWDTVGFTLHYRSLVFGLRADSVHPSRVKAGGGTLHLELDF